MTYFEVPAIKCIPFSLVDPEGKASINAGSDLLGMYPSMSQVLDQSFKTVVDTTAKVFDNTWGVAMKTIGEFAGVGPVSVNSGIRLTTGQEPWSWSASNPGHSTTLTQGEYSKELGTTIFFGGAAQVLNFLEHSPVAAHNTIEAFGKTFTEAQLWGKMSDALSSTLNGFAGLDVIGNIQKSNSTGL